ncbi:MAG: SpoIIIAH-like family protein [Firmicutes bacterium]|nr:SpoIIIAH-like family protein [Bacillota bacterium]
MINKKSIWFLTLFSLILVLSVYYITMPSELLLNTNYQKNESPNEEGSITEDTYLVSLRVEKEEEVLKQINELELILTNEEVGIQEKNEAYNKIKDLNNIKAKEAELEKMIKDNFNMENYIKIKGSQIEVIIKSNEQNTSIANQIMRKIQESFEEEKYITVKFIK